MTATTTTGRGLSLYPTRRPGELRRLALAAEDLGYDNVWFGDSQNIWREVYVAMGAAAVGTHRITFGTGVTNGVTRHRSVVASAWATLHELLDGRVAAGFGVGDSALHTMGARPMKVAELDGLLADLRLLWAGEEVREPGSGAAYRLGYLDRPVRIPSYVAASGPRLLELAGARADGVILLAGTDPDAVAVALATVRAAARDAGRDPGAVHVVLWAPVALDGDPAVARDRVRAHVARTVLRPVTAGLADEDRAAVERIRQAYDYYAHMVPGSAHAELVPDRLVDRFALAGTPDEVRDRVERLAGRGVDQVAMVPFPDPAGRLDELLEAFAAL